MSSNERKTVDQIKKGDRFESAWTGKIFTIEHVIEGGKYVVYKKPSDVDGYSVVEGSVFLREEYKYIQPFFEVGKIYAYRSAYSNLIGSDRYTILSVSEHKGKKVATYVETSNSGDEWFGTLTKNDFAKYGNEVSA